MLAISEVARRVGEAQRNYIFKTVVEDYPASLLQEFPEAQSAIEGFDCVTTKGIFPTRKTGKIVLNWGGEFMHFSGVDESKKEGEFEAIIDRSCKFLDFFEACKDLTGNLENNAALPRTISRLRLGVYLIDIDKKTIRDYRQLTDVMVLGVEGIDLDKAGKDLLKMKVSICWDGVVKDTSKRGKTI
jgi:hypothetical protein